MLSTLRSFQMNNTVAALVKLLKGLCFAGFGTVWYLAMHASKSGLSNIGNRDKNQMKSNMFFNYRKPGSRENHTNR